MVHLSENPGQPEQSITKIMTKIYNRIKQRLGHPKLTGNTVSYQELIGHT